uniref:Uncharacterized protein n=1 Tax=Chenopodium quinoa TaxID=63459 RepID=A0A803NE80_CHEQI
MADVSDLAIQGSKFKEWSLIEGICNVRYQRQLVENHTITGQRKHMLSPTYSRKRLVVACHGQSLESEPNAYEPKNIWNSIINFLDAFYRFSRPHTVYRNSIEHSFSFSTCSAEASDFSPMFFTGMLEVMLDICAHCPPYLGQQTISSSCIREYSTGTGIFIVTSFAILSFWLWSVVGSWPLFWALSVSFVLGTAYSINVRFNALMLPMLRWKRSAVVAAMCILAVRAIIVQIAFFLHMQDIPDMGGDRIFGIRSFTVRLGQKRVFWICISLLQIAYAVAILVGASSSFLWSKLITVVWSWYIGCNAVEKCQIY